MDLDLLENLAQEMAYLQCTADWWYYYMEDQDMSSYMLTHFDEACDIAQRFGMKDEAIGRAIEIYDFRSSGKTGWTPDIEYIETMRDELEATRNEPIWL